MEFQCTEELIYKKPAILDKNKQLTPKNNIEGKNVPKELTLTRKKQTKEKIVDIKEVLKKFEAKAVEIDSSSTYESLMYLDSRQQNYLIQPDYIERRQKNLTWLMRAFLMEWIMQVCY